MAGVGVVEAFGKAVNEDAGIGVVQFHLRVGAVRMGDGEEDVARRSLGGACKRAILASAPSLVVVAHNMIVEHGLHLYAA